MLLQNVQPNRRRFAHNRRRLPHGCRRPPHKRPVSLRLLGGKRPLRSLFVSSNRATSRTSRVFLLKRRHQFGAVAMHTDNLFLRTFLRMQRCSFSQSHCALRPLNEWLGQGSTGKRFECSSLGGGPSPLQGLCLRFRHRSLVGGRVVEKRGSNHPPPPPPGLWWANISQIQPCQNVLPSLLAALSLFLFLYPPLLFAIPLCL